MPKQDMSMILTSTKERKVKVLKERLVNVWFQNSQNLFVMMMSFLFLIPPLLY